MARHPVRITLVVTAVAAALAGGWVYSEFHRAIEHARELATAGTRLAQTLCGPIEYAVAGAGSPVMIVHGAGGGFDQGLAFGAPLAKRFKIISMSRFGYLRTPLPNDASPETQADAHACLLDALNIERAAVIGASAGAPSALQFALRHPSRISALVLMVPAVYVPRAEGGPSLRTPPLVEFLSNTALRSDFLFWAIIKLAPNVAIRSILATPPERVKNASATEQARVQEIMERILPVSARRPGLMNDAAVIPTLQRYELEKIVVPTLAISVADDLYGTFDAARYTAEHIPGARFVGYPWGGHVWVGHQEEVVAEISKFLEP